MTGTYKYWAAFSLSLCKTDQKNGWRGDCHPSQSKEAEGTLPQCHSSCCGTPSAGSAADRQRASAPNASHPRGARPARLAPVSLLTDPTSSFQLLLFKQTQPSHSPLGCLPLPAFSLSGQQSQLKPNRLRMLTAFRHQHRSRSAHRTAQSDSTSQGCGQRSWSYAAGSAPAAPLAAGTVLRRTSSPGAACSLPPSKAPQGLHHCLASEH